jgi:phage terminase large subunit-like protein
MTSSILAAAAGGLISQPPVARDSGHNLQHHATQLASTFTAPQLAVYNAGTRFRMLSCGRRFGKTYLSIGQLLVWALGKPGGVYWYITSTYKAAKRIAWAQLRSMAPQQLVHQVNHSELTLTLINGATISLMGSDNPDSLRGSSLSGAIIDEAAYVHPRVWQEVVRPHRLRQEVVWPLRFGAEMVRPRRLVRPRLLRPEVVRRPNQSLRCRGRRLG